MMTRRITGYTADLQLEDLQRRLGSPLGKLLFVSPHFSLKLDIRW